MDTPLPADTVCPHVRNDHPRARPETRPSHLDVRSIARSVAFGRVRSRPARRRLCRSRSRSITARSVGAREASARSIRSVAWRWSRRRRARARTRARGNPSRTKGTGKTMTTVVFTREAG